MLSIQNLTATVDDGAKTIIDGLSLSAATMVIAGLVDEKMKVEIEVTAFRG